MGGCVGNKVNRIRQDGVEKFWVDAKKDAEKCCYAHGDKHTGRCFFDAVSRIMPKEGKKRDLDS